MMSEKIPHYLQVYQTFKDKALKEYNKEIQEAKRKYDVKMQEANDSCIRIFHRDLESGRYKSVTRKSALANL